VKLALVAGLATNKLWSCPSRIAVFTGFAIYQIYPARPAKILISADCYVPHRVLKKDQAHGVEGSEAGCDFRPPMAKLSRPAPRMALLLPNEIGNQNRNCSLIRPKPVRQHLFAYKRGY
jgi:hypothetical protein